MKIETIISPANSTVAFPKLYKGKGWVRDDLIVLFVAENTGIIVSDHERPSMEGKIQNDFILCTDSKRWEPLPIGSKVIFIRE